MTRPLNALALGFLLLAGTADAAPFASRAQCLAKAQELPDHTFEAALAWEKAGGGQDAQLCQAMALLFRADYGAAADRLEALLPNLKASPRVLAGLWQRAGLANAEADRPDRAEAAYGRAISLDPTDPEPLVDRAILRAGAERYWDALADLDRAAAMAPHRADVLVLRAAAKRKLAQDAPAAADLEKALQLEPKNVEALLARGNLKASRGDAMGARSDWLRVRELAGDTGPARDAADNMAKLDAMEAEARKR